MWQCVARQIVAPASAPAANRVNLLNTGSYRRDYRLSAASAFKQGDRLHVRGVGEHVHNTGRDERVALLIDQHTGIACQ